MDTTTINAAILCLLAMVGAVWANPIRVCPSNCRLTTNATKPEYTLDRNLLNQSVAPWEILKDNQSGRQPENLLYANCKECTLPGYVSKPIYINMLFPQAPVRINAGTRQVCLCPFQLAVGCTCVMKA